MHLGVEVHSNEAVAVKMKCKIEKYMKRARQLYYLLNNTHISRKVKIIFYVIILRPILIYCAECWIL